MSLTRFKSAEIDPRRAIGLRADHPALLEGRTIFPTRVVSSKSSPRFLISGHNNPKLGREVMKGPRKGWPIFHVTLEERATCPRSCEQWATCYGNAMPQSRRHTPDAAFLWLLRAEVATVARQLPNGLLIRLHALGDFYSVAYVAAWAELLARFPQIHVFGYTARRTDDPDPESAKIARALALLTENAWGRFAVRTSASDPVARSRSTVVDEDPDQPDVIVCPAQTGATEACATCGLCWSEAARDKTIAFLRHGMTTRKGPRQPRVEHVQDPARPVLTDKQARVFSALKIRQQEGVSSASLRALSTEAEVSPGSITFLVDTLERKGYVQRETKGKNDAPSTYRIVDIARQRARALIADTGRGIFHRGEIDRREPSQIVTRRLMGDPAPGRTPWAAP